MVMAVSGLGITSMTRNQSDYLELRIFIIGHSSGLGLPMNRGTEQGYHYVSNPRHFTFGRSSPIKVGGGFPNMSAIFHAASQNVNGAGQIRTGDLALQIGVSFPTLWTIPSP